LTWALRPLGPRRGLHAGPVTSNSKELSGLKPLTQYWVLRGTTEVVP